MISEFLLSHFTAGYVAGSIMASMRYWVLAGWRRWLMAFLYVLFMWATCLFAGNVFKALGL